MAKLYAAGFISALAASASASFSSQSHLAYADGTFKLPSFSSPSPPSPSPPSAQSQSSNPPASADNTEASPPKVRNDNPRTTSAGFDPEALERGAKALREITSSTNAKKVSFALFFATGFSFPYVLFFRLVGVMVCHFLIYCRCRFMVFV